MTQHFAKATLVSACIGLCFACSTSGGSNPANGSPQADGTGGIISSVSGGAANGGAAATSGGTNASIGGAATGGTSASGGSATGGTSATGGSATGSGSSIGGASATGGGIAKGGAGTGGNVATGGSVGKGGVSAVGGGSSVGGAISTGGAPSIGGASSQVCAWDAGPSATNGGLTCYWFAQGTSKDEKTCPGGYKTYCGYCGSETGEKPQDAGQIWCPINNIVSTAQNISTVHFVAIPPGPLAQGKNCGACVEVTYRGRTIVATVIDACPSCLTDQHIDLSLSAAKALGMTELIGQVESGVTWRIVGCPTTSNIMVSFNGGYQGQVYFQNAAFPIAKATSGTSVATVNTGFWDFGKVMGGQEVTLTDVMGHTITATVPFSPGTLGVQFPLTCQ